MAAPCSALPRRRILCNGRSRCAKGIRLMKAHQEAPDALSGEQFFERARARLTLTHRTGLTIPNIIPERGDHEPDPVMEKIASIRPIRPAAVLVPVIAREQPMVLLTSARRICAIIRGRCLSPAARSTARMTAPPLRHCARRKKRSA